eukprot:TRINITY_DN13796_c0_g1_i6.p1 TRINITY_DN13796_c0_g1~~TRINITY_DN13796_c0_g1_i6.p1  ORF type:complete len:240 (-),score=35.04 TRINITY_DN13796_c0_g1_i6:99-818(-)
MRAILFLAVALLLAESRIIIFGGYEWNVKDSGGLPVAPGNNVFSSSTDNVFFDAAHHLHLKITYNTTTLRWNCPFVEQRKPLGEGSYKWTAQGPLDHLTSDASNNIVLSTAISNYPIMDQYVETIISKWGNSSATTNGSYCINSGESTQAPACQNWTQPGQIQLPVYLTEWTKNNVVFLSTHSGSTQPPFASWVVDAEQAPPNDNVVVNVGLWFANGMTTLPTTSSVEVVFRSFTHEFP